MSDNTRERLQELQAQYGQWKAQDLGDTLRQRDLLARQARRDDNEAANLCMVLNWTEEEAAIAEEALGHFLDQWQDYAASRDSALQSLRQWQGSLAGLPHCATPGAENFRGVIALLRHLGSRIANAARDEGGFLAWEHLGIADADLFKLNFVANQSPKTFEAECWGPAVAATWTYHRHTSQLVWAARGLWPILAGEAELSECPAPAPGHSDPKMKCGRYFVRGGKLGRPALFCSEACTKRDSRVRKKVAERQGVRGK